MEKDPAIVARLATGRRDENWRFRTFLKMSSRLKHSRVDAAARRFGRQAEAQMDCRSCAACCRQNWIEISDEEIDRLARRVGLPVAEFKDRYISHNEFHEQAIDATPCPFLEGNDCTVYENRPDCCKGYPYVGGNISTRMIGIIERAETCPIIYDMLERLKDDVGFRRYR